MSAQDASFVQVMERVQNAVVRCRARMTIAQPAFGDPRLPQAFWDRVRVDDDTGCWLWTGARQELGSRDPNEAYGRFRRAYAHRASYLALVGPIPPGLVLDHLCSTKLCVHPRHVEPCTQRQNNIRAIRRPCASVVEGRAARRQAEAAWLARGTTPAAALGSRLGRARQDATVTLKKMAAVLAVDVATVKAYEAGKVVPDVATVLTIAQRCGCKPGEILDGLETLTWIPLAPE